VASEGLARHAALVAQRSDALTEPTQISIGLAASGRLGAGAFHGFSANMHYIARQ
jgi:hypothetical protein